MVGNTGLDHGAGPLRMIHRIRVELGLQGYTTPVGVDGAVFAGDAVEEISGVEVDTGAIGGDGHGAAGFRIGENNAGVRVNFKIVVIACLEANALVVSVDVPADGLGVRKSMGVPSTLRISPVGTYSASDTVKCRAGMVRIWLIAFSGLS